MTIIRDPSTNNGAKVNSHAQLKVYATTESGVSHESESHGNAYAWVHAYNYAAADTLLWLRNDDPVQNLVIDWITISGDTTTQFAIHCPSTTAQAGTAVTGTNLNRASGKVALATAIGAETGNTQANVVLQGFLTGNGVVNVPVEGAVILGYLDEIAVDFVTVGTMGIVAIRGYYHDINGD